MLERDGGDGCRARLMPLLVRLRAIWGFSRHKAGSSISCRCASLGGWAPLMLMLSHLGMMRLWRADGVRPTLSSFRSQSCAHVKVRVAAVMAEVGGLTTAGVEEGAMCPR